MTPPPKRRWFNPDYVALREALPVVSVLLALVALPWQGTPGLRWIWDVAQTHYPEAITGILGPVVGLLVLFATLIGESGRGRALIWTLGGFLLLAAGLSDAADAFAARGLGPGVLLAAAVAVVGHRLRNAAALPRTARALLIASGVLALAHFLWPVSFGGSQLPRIAHLVGFAAESAKSVPMGFLALEALACVYLLPFLASALLGVLNRPAGKTDLWLERLHRWAIPAMVLAAAVPVATHLGATNAAGYLAVALAAGAGLHLLTRGGHDALVRAASGEYAEPQARPFLTRLCLTSASGALIFLSFPRYDQIHLAWLCFVPAMFVMTDVTPRRAFLWGWWMGIVTNFGGFHWITGLLVRFALLPLPVALLLALVLAAYNGLVFALWAYLMRRLRPNSRFPLALLSALLFTGVEFLLWELFPWYLGNSQYLFLPAIQIADVAGVSGVTFVVAYVSSTLHAGLRSWARRETFSRRGAVAAAVVLAVTLIYGGIRIAMVDAAAADATKLKIGVVQANQKIRESMSKLRVKMFDQTRMSRLLAKRGADLILLPESAVPFQLPRSTKWLPSITRPVGAPVIFGGSSFEFVGKKRKEYNTAFFVDTGGKVLGLYDKVYLLLFGEYLPWIDKPWMSWVKKLLPYASFLTPGEDVGVFEWRGHRLGMMICYEDILPRFAKRLANKNPHIFLNMTNDAWFGDTAEPYHHQALSVFRAVEHRLYLVRSVRTGVSGFIDATGKIYAQTKVERPAMLLEEVAMMKGTTVYREVGDLFAYLVLAAIAFVLFEAIRARRRAGA